MAADAIDLGAQPPHVRLLILLAKVRLSPAETADAGRLLAAITDWDAFGSMAMRKFSLPLLRRNLSGLDRSMMPEGIWPQIEQMANATAFRSMQILAAQKRFRQACLEPLGIEGLFFKGVNMAAQYYPDLGLRPCRDIDVLVPKGTLKPALLKAREAGYVPVAPDTAVTPMTSERDINAILRFGDSATLVSPDGIVVDLQDHLDKHSGIFSGYDCFANAVHFTVAGETFATLPTDFLVNYLSHHHTRHTWSRLHWLSDLDAICSGPDFDRAAVLSMADRLGQRGTVEASLELHALMSTRTQWDNGEALARGKSFLRLCISNLPGDLALEKHLGLRMMGGEFMYPWQARPELIARARRGWWRHIFRPTLSNYARLPLPEPLQWVYYVPRFVELAYLTQQRLRPVKKTS